MLKALHTLAGIRRVNGDVSGSEEASFTLLTVDAVSVMLAVLAHSTAFIVAMDIQRLAIQGHVLIIGALCSMAMAVASCNPKNDINIWDHMILVITVFTKMSATSKTKICYFYVAKKNKAFQRYTTKNEMAFPDTFWYITCLLALKLDMCTCAAARGRQKPLSVMQRYLRSQALMLSTVAGFHGF